MRVSIADVAKRANVSISTVSRVINRRELVQEDTCRRVEEAIQALGYRPNGFARGLMLGRSEMIGLVLPDLHGEFYSEIIRGADEQAREMGYSLVVSSIRPGDDGQSLVRTIQQRGLLDGAAFMIAEVTDGLRGALTSFPYPFVVLDNDLPGAPHDSVIIDQKHGAVELMHHITGPGGARRVVFVGGLATNVDTRLRLEAYREVLTQLGRPIRDEDIHFLDYQYESAYRLAGEHLEDWAQPGTCVFAANDEMAAGILAAAAAHGVPVPKRLSVAGFDDTRIARMTHPPLTTVRVPMSLMGREAVRLLCQRLADAERPATKVTLQPEVVIRESCGPLEAVN